MNRRHFLATAAPLALAPFLNGAQPRPRLIVLRSGWQPINIGDIAHTPGVLRLLERHLPDAEVVLWKASANEDVEAMLRRAFPRVRIFNAQMDAKGQITGKDLLDALQRMDLFLHGSGPSLVAQRQVEYVRKMGKPYGVYGITLGDISDNLRDLLSGAACLFTRETLSLEAARKAGIKCPVMDFAPDGTFALDLRDDDRARKFLGQHGLEEGRFLVAVPRLRWTPYARLGEAELKRRGAINEEFAEVDHAKLRTAIIEWVRQTRQKVCICPEMTYQVDVGRKLLYEPLPDDVKKLVVHRDSYWLPNEAASVYARAKGVVSFEMHSPIIALAANTPAIYLRQPTDTRKGQMMRDIGLADWIFEIDETTGDQIARRVLEWHANPSGARDRLNKAMTFVRQRQRDTMAVVGKAAGVG